MEGERPLQFQLCDAGHGKDVTGRTGKPIPLGAQPQISRAHQGVGARMDAELAI